MTIIARSGSGSARSPQGLCAPPFCLLTYSKCILAVAVAVSSGRAATVAATAIHKQLIRTCTVPVILALLPLRAPQVVGASGARLQLRWS